MCSVDTSILSIKFGVMTHLFFPTAAAVVACKALWDFAKFSRDEDSKLAKNRVAF